MSNQAYILRREDLESITDADFQTSTTKLLPSPEQVPEEFKKGNIYTRTVEAVFQDKPLPKVITTFRSGFQDSGAAMALSRCATAHLKSPTPPHEHKIAALGYLISFACEIQEA